MKSKKNTKKLTAAQKAEKFFDGITTRILDLIESDKIAPWHKSWNNTGGGYASPNNPDTKTVYSGVNKFMLSIAGYSDSRWLTYLGVQKYGGNVLAGQKATAIRQPVPYQKEIETGQLDENDKPIIEIEERIYFGIVPVFNIQQTNLLDTKVFTPEQIEETEAQLPVLTPEATDAEQLVLAYSDVEKVRVNKGDYQPHYRPSEDQIYIPTLDMYEDCNEYYSTYFHEIAHSTGHAKRLNRGWTKFDHFGSDRYGFEELVAEFTNAFICADTGITNTIDNSAAYINSWSKAIKANKKLVAEAAAAAQLAFDRIKATLKVATSAKARALLGIKDPNTKTKKAKKVKALVTV